MTTSAITSLPQLTSDFSLSAQDIEGYQENGHVLLRSVASANEVAAYRTVITKAATRLNTEKRAIGERDTYGKAFLQTMNLWVSDDAVKGFSRARRFGKIAARLMGVDAVRLYHDQALFKEPHGGHTPWHQDQYYWPLDTNKTITMWMPLVDLSEDMGIMQFASKSNQHGYLGKLPISDKSAEIFQQFVKEKGFAITDTRSMNAGDATFHSGWTLHSAGQNRSDKMREVMTIIYFADGTRILNPDHPNRVQDLATWLPGLKPGDLAASPLNPRID